MVDDVDYGLLEEERYAADCQIVFQGHIGRYTARQLRGLGVKAFLVLDLLDGIFEAVVAIGHIESKINV